MQRLKAGESVDQDQTVDDLISDSDDKAAPYT